MVMARMGFTYNFTGDAHHVEYVKDYAEPNGRLARLSILFTKHGYMQVLDQAQLAKFVVTVQATIEPVIEEVKTKAPKALQADMLHAMDELEGVREYVPAPETVECGLCGENLIEWTINEDGTIHCGRPDLCEQQEPSETPASPSDDS